MFNALSAEKTNTFDSDFRTCFGGSCHFRPLTVPDTYGTTSGMSGVLRACSLMKSEKEDVSRFTFWSRFSSPVEDMPKNENMQRRTSTKML